MVMKTMIIFKTKNNSRRKKENLKIIPLGGLLEIGKNITVFEYGNEIVLVDCGLEFPEDDMLGVDLVIPDTTYIEKNITKEDIVTELEYFDAYKGEGSVVFSPYILLDVFKENVRKNYNQMSLFFKTNRIRDKAVKEIDNEMILCVSADTTINQDAEDALLSMILGIILLFGWIISIIFLGFFVNLCSNKSILAFKGDMAIMRSMGIPTKIIKLGIYVRMLLCVIPAIILLCIGAYLLYSNPNTNELFVYLYPWHYIVIVLGVILLVFRITRKQVKNLFGKSVRKSLKGGDH